MTDKPDPLIHMAVRAAADCDMVAAAKLDPFRLCQIVREQAAEIDALKENCPYPWCPECKIECRAVDEDGCCSSCGVDTVWTEASDVPLRKENARLRNIVERAIRIVDSATWRDDARAALGRDNATVPGADTGDTDPTRS